MSIPNLPVNFKDDILAASNVKRKYRQTTNDDSTVSFEDVTNYSQEGSEFGAKEVNQTNGAINNIYNERILTLEEAALVTEPGFFVDAQVITELNGNNYELDESEDTYESERIWYKKYNNGLIEYWGRCSSPAQVTGGQGFATINFPVPFKDMNYIVTATAEYASSSTITFETSVQRNSTSRAYVYARTNTGIVTGAWIQWEAKGYWK